MTENPDVASVERYIAAPAEAIFALLADPSRHREIDGSGTVRDVKGGSQQLKLGSKFGMSMKLGIPYSMVNEVVEFEPNRRIAWQTKPPIGLLTKLAGGRIWRYELTPKDGGTIVRESWDITHEVRKSLVRPMRSATIKNMTKTLDRLEAAVTSK